MKRLNEFVAHAGKPGDRGYVCNPCNNAKTRKSQLRAEYRQYPAGFLERLARYRRLLKIMAEIIEEEQGGG